MISLTAKIANNSKYNTPNVISRGTDKQTNTQIFGPDSGISSHSFGSSYCRVHTVSVSTHSCSLRRVCPDPWHPTIIPPIGNMLQFHCGIPSSQTSADSFERNDCRANTVSVSTHSCSLRRVCPDPWHPTIIPPIGDMLQFHRGFTRHSRS